MGMEQDEGDEEEYDPGEHYEEVQAESQQFVMNQQEPMMGEVMDEDEEEAEMDDEGD